ncbi:hypothetical protein CANARDRAFT_28954 [[Candida] arabinofermentans NRRL YB-2248]|uniref:trans-L-3-hydroxyproline dehydratase n=1 Tax=[Candida] arabinofermentans NRRL YB-2248 TaxID=983967 RepID=A0A1E4SZC9_9ASCO|nr:hypothetical protein CANARDRAFT_28954 [[Candida] arabinofermentans NRRL YB-2248]
MVHRNTDIIELPRIETIETHASGEPFRLVVNGLPKDIPGRTLLEKRSYLQLNHDGIRLTLMREPRGHYDMFGGFLMDPIDSKADFGVLFCNPSGYTDQCGHGMIATVTAALSMHMLPEDQYKLKPELTTVVLETTVGLVNTEACWNGSRVEFVRFTNTPVYILYENISVETSIGQINGDIVFNGAFNFFAELSSKDIQINPSNAPILLSLGFEIKKEIQKMGLEISSKDFPQIKGIHGVNMAIVNTDKDMMDETDKNQNSILVMGLKQIDRSACGSGTAGRAGQLFLKGKLSKENVFVNESIIGSRFKARIVQSDIKVNNKEYNACIVQIEGHANVLGTANWFIDPADTIAAEGFVISR